MNPAVIRFAAAQNPDFVENIQIRCRSCKYPPSRGSALKGVFLLPLMEHDYERLLGGRPVSRPLAQETFKRTHQTPLLVILFFRKCDSPTILRLRSTFPSIIHTRWRENRSETRVARRVAVCKEMSIFALTKLTVAWRRRPD